MAKMVLCPIALAVHCTGCPFVKFCPAKTLLGDYDENDDKQPPDKKASKDKPDDRTGKSDSTDSTQ